MVIGFFWVSVIVTGLLVQFQSLLFSSVVWYTLPIQKIAFFFLLVMVGGGFWNDDDLFARRVRLSLYLLLICFFVGAFYSSLDVFSNFQYFLASYLFFFAVPLLSGSDGGLFDCARKYLVFIFLPVAILGIFQFELNDPIVDVGGEGLGFEVMSWNFYGQIRAFSLFLSGLDFGYYLCVMGVLFLSSALSSGLRIQCLFLLVLCIYCIAITSTRLIYILFFFSIVTFISVRFSRSLLLIYLLPVVYLVVGSFFVLYLGGALASAGYDISSDDSLFERYYYWDKAFNIWAESEAPQKLFGLGLSQGASLKDYIVDNVYLNTLVQSGLVGLFALIFFFFVLWMSLVKSLGALRDNFSIALFSFFSTFLIAFVLNTNQFQYALFVLPLISKMRAHQKS